MDAELGKLITPEAQRDAIHVAIAPVQAGCNLEPGEHIGFWEDGRVGPAAVAIGIVDPFLDGFVKEGEWFYLCLYPKTVTGMRHHWQHPAFSDEEAVVGDKAESERWLRNYVENAGPPYELVIEALGGPEDPNRDDDPDYGSCHLEGDTFVSYGWHAYGEIPYEFWKHAEIVLGKKIPHRATRWSCSC